MSWLNHGGFSGVQTAIYKDGHIPAPGGDDPNQKCTEGHFCSYACPPGFQKTQWPPMPNGQPENGSVLGGLKCQGRIAAAPGGRTRIPSVTARASRAGAAAIPAGITSPGI